MPNRVAYVAHISSLFMLANFTSTTFYAYTSSFVMLTYSATMAFDTPRFFPVMLTKRLRATDFAVSHSFLMLTYTFTSTINAPIFSVSMLTHITLCLLSVPQSAFLTSFVRFIFPVQTKIFNAASRMTITALDKVHAPFCCYTGIFKYQLIILRFLYKPTP